jgi:hypothetical protein
VEKGSPVGWADCMTAAAAAVVVTIDEGGSLIVRDAEGWLRVTPERKRVKVRSQDLTLGRAMKSSLGADEARVKVLAMDDEDEYEDSTRKPVHKKTNSSNANEDGPKIYIECGDARTNEWVGLGLGRVENVPRGFQVRRAELEFCNPSCALFVFGPILPSESQRT